MDPLFIDPDISKAETLPSDFYRDDRYFEMSKEKIFSRSWQFVCDTDEVRVAGQIFPFFMLENYLDIPLIITRDRDDRLHCLSNVCTHRGNILTEAACIEKNIRCRYHGRRFELDGKFISMPEFAEVKNFPSPKDDLPEIPFYSFDKFLFASLNPAAPVHEFTGDMFSRVSFLPLNEFKRDPSKSRDYIVKAHWALYCENYLEGFHIPYVHNSLNEKLDYSGYTTELFRFSNLQTGISRGGESCFELPGDHPDHGKNISAYYFWIFPNLMFNFYPWGLSLNIIKPLKKNLTRVSFISYVYDESKLQEGAGGDLDKVEREDETIVENVQRGISSGLYERGRYSVKRETGTHHFHRLISDFITH
ncbi:MAG: aromatic ring-hydroxylating dioxygenase subunit alpha [Bacteroidetes bacterium]|nr:aromatic ring-hydroxylating dioxygenase subunit alpha [Bacteroidota bacterium]